MVDVNRTIENEKFLRRLAILWSLFSIFYLTGITFFDIPPENVRFVDTVIGFLLGTIVSSIIQFFFGSSLGSKEKDRMGTNDVNHE
jgi:hypothetical protein